MINTLNKRGIVINSFDLEKANPTTPSTGVPGQSGAQVGERKKWKDGWYVKQENGQWKKDKNQGEAHKQEEEPGKVTKPQEQEQQKQGQKQGEEPNKVEGKQEELSQKKQGEGEHLQGEKKPLEGKPGEEQEKQQEVEKPLHEKTKEILMKVTQDFNNILENKEWSPEEKLTRITKLGITDPKMQVAMTQVPLSQVLKNKEEGPKVSIETQQRVVNNVTLPEPSVKARWMTYEFGIKQVLNGNKKALFAYGTGGVGKTFTLQSELDNAINPVTEQKYQAYDDELDMGPDDYDYISIGGKSTPTALYQSLYEHNGKLIIYDDCDSVLEDPTALMILKKVLDTSGDGTVDYQSTTKLKTSKGEPVPYRFKFTGKVIFVSNIPKEKKIKDKNLAAVLSRTLAADLTMTADETIEKLESIKDKIKIKNYQTHEEIPLTSEDKTNVLDFFKKYKDSVDISKLNVRTFMDISLILAESKQHPEDFKDISWEDLAIATFGS